MRSKLVWEGEGAKVMVVMLGAETGLQIRVKSPRTKHGGVLIRRWVANTGAEPCPWSKTTLLSKVSLTLPLFFLVPQPFVPGEGCVEQELLPILKAYGSGWARSECPIVP